MHDKVFQEWYCGECKTYIKFRLSMDWDRTVLVVCPSCQHEHQRFIKDGVIKEDGRYSNGHPTEHICPPKSAASKEPITKKLKESKWGTRDGIVIKSSEDLVRDNYMRERWIELYGDGTC